MDEFATAEVVRGDPMQAEPDMLAELVSQRGQVWRVWIGSDGYPLIKHVGYRARIVTESSNA